jgi:hypothetical protein
MQFELSKLLESALEEDSELDKIKQINKVFKVINEAMPYPDRLMELSKDTFLMKNLLLCRPYHQKSVSRQLLGRFYRSAAGRIAVRVSIILVELHKESLRAGITQLER